MPSVITTDIPDDFSRRIKTVRGVKGLTQAQFAALLGVSFASVNRWENRQSRPSNLAWRRILDLERGAPAAAEAAPDRERPSAARAPDFSADPDAVAAVAEAHRLACGHMFNPAFATETAHIDPLPHQRIAVYEHMLHQSPLRFLLADDAGAGKTIMTGLYVREMLSRRLIRRVLVVPPAGLVGNWRREMRDLFRLRFRILSGADARAGNPFVGPESDLVIVSLDTLAGARMSGRLRETATEPYDLVVFDEAHKLSANREPDFRVRKTDRYRLAEALIGAGADGVDDERWALPWSARHLLLLTATPHMGQDHPYYFLWRLLLPDVLSTFEAFAAFPREARRKHFIRRTKEEMVRFDGVPLYPQRNCDTLSYDLSQGAAGEQALYDATTDYIRDCYNRARVLNRSAARLAMGVFQRRLASSTYALLRSFERRQEKLQGLIDEIRSGRLTEEQLARRQRRLDTLDDPFETRTADEEAMPEDGGERREGFESRALGGTVAISLAELEAERLTVESLRARARALFDRGEESKFEKLREVLRDPRYLDRKLIVFTEHRDTAYFLTRRLEGLGYTGRVASIHGGMPYRERERQIALFRKPASEGGATYLVATDAAGEGVNLQFCWLMVNYDIPWNPARLEQRMGRIHRYGQKHDPVVIVNLIAGKTREGRVLKTLLDKLEAMRKQLRSDKVFDVVGRLFEGLSFKDYLEQAVAEDDPDSAALRLEGRLTEAQIRALEEKERALFGEGGDVRRALGQLDEETKQEGYRRLLPGYVRRFVEKAAPLLDLRVEGEPGGNFTLSVMRPGARDPLLPAFELYPEEARDRLTFRKPDDGKEAIWLHPGEPVFDRLSDSILDRFGNDARRGAAFVDPTASEPYLFHLAAVTIGCAAGPAEPVSSDPPGRPGADGSPHSTAIESRLVGLRQTGDGAIEETPVEHLLLLRGLPRLAPGRIALAASARRMASEAAAFAREEVAERIARSHRRRILDELPARLDFVNRGFDHRAAELAAARARYSEPARAGEANAKAELGRIKERQRSLAAARDRRLAALRAEPERVRVGAVAPLAHALVVPSRDAGEAKRFDAEVEAIAMKVATAYEESFGAEVGDVSRPALARRAGLTDWPGFDLLSVRPDAERRAIEVKGRAGAGEIEISENEWAKACNLRGRYWLYVVFDCASPKPRLVRVRDPFRNLLVKAKGGVLIPSAEVLSAAEPEGA